jgi:hypothetical protein
MSWWHRILRQLPPEEADPEEQQVGYRSTILPPPPPAEDRGSPATMRVPRVPDPANDLIAWTDDGPGWELRVEENLAWEEPDEDRATTRRDDPGHRPVAVTWKCRVA